MACFKGHTYYIQKTFNEAFADTPVGSECTIDTLRRAVDGMVASNDTIFREILSNVPEKQKTLLYAIARDGEAERITSADFIGRTASLQPVRCSLPPRSCWRKT